MPPQTSSVPDDLIASDESYSSTSVGSGTTLSSYLFFKPKFANQLDFRKAAFSRHEKTYTVFRPFPCADPRERGRFLPYRIDPGGKNEFGYWIKQLWVAWNVGSPSLSFIVHNPRWGRFDARMTPLGTLIRAVQNAVKKGKGKASDWGRALKVPFDPDHKTLLEWDGMLEGDNDSGALISRCKPLYLAQGYVPCLGSKVTYDQHQPPIGWGSRPPCVFGMTGALGESLFNLLGEEKPGYRGSPEDFENRYVHGDPVALSSGRYIYIYPKGGDPRQNRYENQPAGFDPLAQSGAAGQGGRRRASGTGTDGAGFGFDCHLETSWQNLRPAIDEKYREQVWDRWRHWDDSAAKDEYGRPKIEGILHYPSYAEQAELLSRVLPAQILVYAFYGEHNDWLTEDVRRKAVEARSATVPDQPPPVFRPSSPPGGPGHPADHAADPFGGPPGPAPADPGPFGQPPAAAAAPGPYDAPPGWSASLPPAGGYQPAAPAAPASRAVADQALPSPAALPSTTPPAAVQSVDDILASMGADPRRVFDPPPGAAPPQPPAHLSPSAAAATAGSPFEQTTPPPPESPQARTAQSVAALAAARALAARQSNPTQ